MSIDVSPRDEFICRAARNMEEAMKLVESGFKYVCDIDRAKLFRRK
ncbi:hypothetical protein KEJ27_03615 [Candidatus Bathyarchaeota archaeon]|nr:hypothetical protein [Candidatus Bathyarchaeota archaeon]MBS7613604.1 hypothetical protein [Candidatus Bathyarchaeota archaeon]MBS7617999.1 hypothetical protein [Candidatus Bathyarchaeota archaeon]